MCQYRQNCTNKKVIQKNEDILIILMKIVLELKKKDEYLILKMKNYVLQLEESEVVLTEDKQCIFKFIQKLLIQGGSGSKSERLRRIWEPTYT